MRRAVYPRGFQIQRIATTLSFAGCSSPDNTQNIFSVLFFVFDSTRRYRSIYTIVHSPPLLWSFSLVESLFDERDNEKGDGTLSWNDRSGESAALTRWRSGVNCTELYEGSWNLVLQCWAGYRALTDNYWLSSRVRLKTYRFLSSTACAGGKRATTGGGEGGGGGQITTSRRDYPRNYPILITCSKLLSATNGLTPNAARLAALGYAHVDFILSSRQGSTLSRRNYSLAGNNTNVRRKLS